MTLGLSLWGFEMKKISWMLLATVLFATSTFAFSTQAKADLVYVNPTGVASWDTEASTFPGLEQSVNVTENLFVTGVTLELRGLTHSWLGDLSVELIAPDSTTMFVVGQLTGESGGGFGDDSNWNGTYLFSDDGTSLWTEAALRTGTEAISPGIYRASQASSLDPTMEQVNSFTSFFAGKTTQGDWTVRFYDSSGFGESGELSDWTLTIQTTAVPEPTSAIVITGIGIGLLTSRRRRR